MVSPTLMGRDLKPSGTADSYAALVTIVAQLLVSLLYACIIAPLVTRFRGMWAIGLGGLIGLGLYGLTFLVFHFLQGLDWSGSELPVLVTHLVFGLVVAGLYKGLAARRWIRETGAAKP
jgi:hypothetical protein